MRTIINLSFIFPVIFFVVFIVTLINVVKRSKKSVFDSLKDLPPANPTQQETNHFIRCEYCGTELDKAQKKCPSCGAKVGK